MSRSSSRPPRPFRTAYFASQGLANRNLPTRFGHASTLKRACNAACGHLLGGDFVVAVVYDEFGARSTTLTRKGRQITIVGLLP